MKIFQKMLNTLKRVLPSKKEIDKEIGEIPMRSSREVWLCPLVPTKVMEECQKDKFEVFVDDNFHYMDESERYRNGVYDNYEEAVEACKAIIDSYLPEQREEGQTADELYKGYVIYGEDPFIIPTPTNKEVFSAWSYAKQSCKEICG